MKAFSNLSNYIAWRGDLSFTQAPFCEVDNLILSVLIYHRFSLITGKKPITLKHAFELYAMLPETTRFLGTLVPQNLPQFAKESASCRRFSEVLLANFTDTLDETRQMQFAAGTYLLPDGSIFVAFRGTDDTLVGWKEDLNMSFASPIPSQLQAVRYLETAAARYPNAQIRVGGHSKGGNLAQYAAIHASAEIQRRILAAYSNDGPGFEKTVPQQKGYIAIRERLHTLIPQSSVVGMFLTYNENYRTVSSKQNGIFQHDPMSWEVIGDHFITLPHRSPFGKRADRAIKDWLEAVPPQKQKDAFEALYRSFLATNAKTVTDLKERRYQTLLALMNSMNKIDKATAKEFAKLFRTVFLQFPQK